MRAGGAEMADIDHARADEDLVDPVSGDLGQELDVVRVIGTGQDRLPDLVQVDLEDGGVFGVLRRAREGRVCPATFRRRAIRFSSVSGILIALRRSSSSSRRHCFSGIVATLSGLRAMTLPGRGPLGRGVRQLVGLIHGQDLEALDLEDPVVEDVLLALFWPRSEARCLMAKYGMALTTSRSVMPGLSAPRNRTRTDSYISSGMNPRRRRRRRGPTRPEG